MTNKQAFFVGLIIGLFITALISIIILKTILVPPSNNSISVTDSNYNGGDSNVCSGQGHDDRTAFQNTLNYANQHSILFVTMPGKTCYMNSVGGTSGQAIYNLQIPNNVTLQGTTGSSKILQTATGRPTCTSLCTVTVINMGIFAVTWSKIGCNVDPCSGYDALHATTAGLNTVTLSNTSNSSKFHPGDYITLYDHQPKQIDDVINGFQSTVQSVNNGVIVLADAVARTYQAPFIGNINSHVSHDMGLSGIIVEGVVPLLMTESFRITIENSQLINDTSSYGNSSLYVEVPQWNSIEHLNFNRNQVIFTGSYHLQGWSAELTQRNSGFESWKDNIIGSANIGPDSWGMAEYAHDIEFDNNMVYLNSPPSHSGCGFNIGAKNANVINNHIHTTGSWVSQGGGEICDVLAPFDTYYEYGNINYTGNTIECNAPGIPCINFSATQGTKFNGNHVIVYQGSSSLYGLLLQYYPSDAQINNNTFDLQDGYGIYAIPPSDGGWTINGNTVTAKNGNSGITVGATSYPGGPCSVQNNIVNGFNTALSGDPSHTSCTLGGNSGSFSIKSIKSNKNSK